jgi:uncharacterized repeat protein (TIGR01451 family)
MQRLTISRNSAANGGGIGTFIEPGATGFATFLHTSTFDGNSASAHGGGLVGGRLKATSLTVSNNGAARGGGVYLVPAGKPSAISGRNTISANTATQAGGGVYAAGCGASCGILFNTNITGNSAPLGSGVYVEGGLSMSSVAVYQNHTVGQSSGGAVYHTGSAGDPLLMTNVTVNANSGGTLTPGVLIDSNATDEISFGTIDTNTGGVARDLYVYPSAAAPKVEATIVSGAGPNCAGKVVSLGYNLDSGTRCRFSQPSDQANANIRLEAGPVAHDNGGFTKTRAIYNTNSPALNAVPAAKCPATDARAVLRPQGSRCDIGAFELGPGTRNNDVQLGAFTVSPNPAARGDRVHYAMTVANVKGPAATFRTVLIDRLPSSLDFISCTGVPSGHCAHSGGIVTVTWPSGLAIGEVQTVRIVARVVAPPNVNAIKNVATVYSDNPDHYPTNNVASCSLSVSS